MDKKKILVLCTGNSCRSQMAEGYLKYFAGDKVSVFSAGIEAHGVNPLAVKVMKEDGIDISGQTSDLLDKYLSVSFDYVITVCDHAQEKCPYFPSQATRLHQNFPDPAKEKRTEEHVLNTFRRVRNLIKEYCKEFVDQELLIHMIRNVTISDSAAIAKIYNHYVVNTTVTFEEKVVSSKVMAERISEVTKKFPWLVLEEQGRILGYAYAGPWKSRPAYRHSVEVSVYLDKDETGKGLGSKLYEQLLIRLEALNLHGIIGGIALPNEGCISLHKKFGFEKVAHFKEVGYKFNQWIDVTYWERILSRSNPI